MDVVASEGQGSGHTVGRGGAQERKQGRRYIIRTGNTVRRPRTNGAVAVGGRHSCWRRRPRCAVVGSASRATEGGRVRRARLGAWDNGVGM